MRTYRQRLARKIADRWSGFVMCLRMYRLWSFSSRSGMGFPTDSVGWGAGPLPACVPATATSGWAIDDTPGLANSDLSPVVGTADVPAVGQA